MEPEEQDTIAALSLIAGEWWEIDCRLERNNTHVNVTLLKGGNNWYPTPKKEVNRDNKNIAIFEPNFFKILKLKLSDGGRYYCEICGIQKYAGEIYVTGMVKINFIVCADLLAEYGYRTYVQ